MLLYVYTWLVWLYCYLFAPSSLFDPPTPSAAGPTVRTTQATFIGFTRTVDAQPLDLFQGIRYAQAPLGDLRFRRTRPMGSGKKTHTVTRYRESCMQQGKSSSGNSELPVMVWIHGGGFQWGNGNVNGSRLVAESVRLNAPIIFISINYRLNAFGFMMGSSMLTAAKAAKVSLNAGLYDARMALRWVQQHVSDFGGDPGRVTIAGQSAGAFIVGNTLLSNRSRTNGLFHAAIMESGFAGGASTLPPDHPRHEQTYSQIARAVGCPVQSSDMACLKGVSASKLSAAANDITQSFQDTPQLGGYPFMPVQDARVNSFWFSAPPRDLINQGKIANVPVIAGHNLDEGTLSAPKDLQNSQQFANYVRNVAFANTSDAALADKVLKNLLSVFPNDLTAGAPFYNEGTAVSAGTTDLTKPYFGDSSNQFKRAASFYGAWRYIGPHRRFIQKQSANNGGRVWSYVFKQHDKQMPEWQGVAHSAELNYVYGNTSGSSGFYRPLSKTVQRAWISFVTYHDPRRLGSVDWPTYSQAIPSALQIKGQGVQVILDTARADQLEFIKSSDTATVFSS
ncbi:hypothetical protein V8E36_009789 [Tilletia maclaganii]